MCILPVVDAVPVRHSLCSSYSLQQNHVERTYSYNIQSRFPPPNTYQVENTNINVLRIGKKIQSWKKKTISDVSW